MLMLEYHNLLLKSVLTERLLDEVAPSSIDQIVSDFDNVKFHISTPVSPDTEKLDLSKIVVSLYVKCYNDLAKYGANEVLQREYGEYIMSPPEQGYDFSLLLDLEKIIPNKTLEQRQELVDKISMLKRNAMAAPFEKAFAAYDKLSEEAQQMNVDLSAPEHSNNEVMAIHYREEESIFVIPAHDRVTVMFSTVFRDETDRIFGKVFLQEFVDARRRAVQNAPQVLFSAKELPLELRNLPGIRVSEDMGYVTFVLFPRHLTPQRRENCISHIQIFRDYFHYHIKCSKAYMHSRMRYRVNEFLKVLNRAKPENAEKERKTATGRRFR